MTRIVDYTWHLDASLAEISTHGLITCVHISSNGKDQSEGMIMGVEVSNDFKVLKVFKQSSSKTNFTSLASKFVNGLAIFENP